MWNKDGRNDKWIRKVEKIEARVYRKEKWDGATVRSKEKKFERREWKRRVMGEKEQWRHERELCLLVLQWTHSHELLCVTCYCVALLSIKSKEQNTLEKLTTKPTNTEPVKLLLRKWSQIFLGYCSVSTAEVWSNERINAELLCVIAKPVSTHTHWSLLMSVIKPILQAPRVTEHVTL